jgi:hypothetical protein
MAPINRSGLAGFVVESFMGKDAHAGHDSSTRRCLQQNVVPPVLG